MGLYSIGARRSGRAAEQMEEMTQHLAISRGYRGPGPNDPGLKRAFVMVSPADSLNPTAFQWYFAACLKEGNHWIGTRASQRNTPWFLRSEFCGEAFRHTEEWYACMAKAQEVARAWRKEFYGPDEWVDFARGRLLHPEKFRDVLEA